MSPILHQDGTEEDFEFPWPWRLLFYAFAWTLGTVIPLWFEEILSIWPVR